MRSRRSVLIGGARAALGGVLIAACSRRRNLTADPTDSSPASPSTEPAEDPIISAPDLEVPWANADFGELDAFIESTNGRGFAIVDSGTLVHEWYRDDANFRRDVASAQKSVLSLLVGRAVTDELLTLDTRIDDVLGNGWTDHGETSNITVRHLLTMTSGLDDRLRVVTPPDTAWLYSGAFAVLFDVLVTATDRDLNELASDWLFTPAGASTAQFYERQAARFAPIGLLASTRDLTAIGTWVLDQLDDDGDASEWLRASFRPDQSLNESYGSLWWLNGQGSFVLPATPDRTRPGPLIPSAPTDLVAALGRHDQKLYISRELSLVVARIGDQAVPEARQALSSFDDDLWSMLLDLRG